MHSNRVVFYASIWRLSIASLLAISLLAALVGCSKVNVEGFHSKQVAGIAIKGSARFRQIVSEDLAYMARLSPRHHSLVVSNLSEIASCTPTGVEPSTGQTCFGPSYFASHISSGYRGASYVHEAIHVRQFRNGSFEHKTSQQIEREAIRHQLAACRKLQCSGRELAHIAAQDGTHADLDGDGDRDQDDVDMQMYKAKRT